MTYDDKIEAVEEMLEEDFGIEDAFVEGSEYDACLFSVVDPADPEGTLDTGMQFLVYTEDEVDDALYDYVENILDEVGSEGFSKGYLDNFIDQDWMNNLFREDIESYVNDMSDEDVFKEAEDAGLVDEDTEIDDVDIDQLREDLIEYKIDDYGDVDFDYFAMNFGSDEALKWAIDSNAIDIGEIAEDLKRNDSGTLASYDGEERCYGDFYIYRIN